MLVYTALLHLNWCCRVPVWMGRWWCKVIIISNPTAVEVVLSCIEVVVGVLTIYVGVKVEVDIVVEVDFQLLVRVGFFK